MQRSLPAFVVPAFLCLVLGALGGVGTALLTQQAPARPPSFTPPHTAPPDFRLRDEDGVWRSPESARGNVLLITFIYTHCPTLCPRQAAELKEAVVAAGPGVEVYAITVDPERDTPEEAHAWLRKMGVEEAPVHILGGTRAELSRVWDRFGIVPIAQPGERAEPRAAAAEYEALLDGRRRNGFPFDRGPTEPLPRAGGAEEHEESDDSAPAREPDAALDPYPALDDGAWRGRPRHPMIDFEHSAYAILVDKRGNMRVGFPFEHITAERVLQDMRLLLAEPD